jgi:hypothetical protein
MVKNAASAFLICLTALVGIPNQAIAEGTNIPFTSNNQVALTSDVDGKVVPRGDITITVGNMLGTPNAVNCSTSGNLQNICNYSLGLALIKKPEKFSYDLSKNLSISRCFLYDDVPSHVSDWCNSYAEYGAETQSFGGVKADVQLIGHSYNLQASKYLQFTFSTVGWPGGDYTLMAFSSAASYGTSKSNPLNFTLPPIPKTTIECIGPQSTHAGMTFNISCTSTLPLVSTPVNVNSAGTTSTAVLGGAIANGNKFEIPNVKIESVGVAKLQVSIPPIIDTLQSSTSNVMAIQIMAPLIIPNILLTLSKSEVAKPSLVTVSSDPQGLPIKLQASQKIDGPWVDIASGVSGASAISVAAPVGNWVRAHFLGTGEVAEQFSDPVQVLLTPTVKCAFPHLIKSGELFTINCSSSITLPNILLSFDYLPATTAYYKSTAWQSLGKVLVKGGIGAVNFKWEGSGSYMVRTSSNGGGNYSGFQSNSASIAFAVPPASHSSTSTSGAGNANGKINQSSSSQSFVIVPSLIGLNGKDLQRNARSYYPNFRIILSTDLHAQHSISCQLAGQATVINQLPRAGSRVRINSTISAYLDC